MYNVNEFKFMNMKRDENFLGKATFFEIEKELTREEKIAFIDYLEDGIASYMIGFIEKWNKEKDSLSKDNYGYIRTVSKKAWIKRNDYKKKVNKEYDIGSYYLFGTKYKYLDLICPTTEYGHKMLYTDSDIVNQWFHDLCIQLKNKEIMHFRDTNSREIKLEKVRNLTRQFGIFNNKKLNDMYYNNDREAEEETLDKAIETFKEFAKVYDDFSLRFKDLFGSEDCIDE